MFSLRNLLIDQVRWNARDESGHSNLTWIAPWNKEFLQDAPMSPNDSYLFQMTIDWYDHPLHDGTIVHTHPTEGACYVSILGFFWCLMQGEVEKENGPITANRMYLPPQLEIVDELSKGKFRVFLYKEWMKLCEAIYAKHIHEKICKEMETL